MDNFDLKKYLAEGKLHENEYFDAYHEAGDKLENHPNYNKLVSILKDKGFEPDGTPYSDGTGRRDVHGVWDVFKSYITEPGSRGTTLTKANAKDINDALRQAGIEDIKATPSNSYSFRLKVNNLAEGRLLKEEIDYSSIKDEMKKIYDIDVDLDTIKDFVTSYNDSEGMDVFDTTEREDFYLYLKDLAEGKLLKEVMDEEMVDYVSAMYDSDVDQEAEEGFQSDVWSKAQYASNAYNESSIFLELIDHLKSVGGKDVVEGNPDIELELLPNGDIRWSANVTHY